jgi:hypothetical protein
MNLKKQREVKTVISVIFGVSLAYAIIRYQIFGSVPWRELPLYIINKALSLSALLLLLLALSLKALEKRGWGIAISLLESRATLAKSGFLLLLMHVSISLLLFGSSNYKKFFIEDGSLTLYAGLSMLGGVLAFVILWSIESNKEKRCLFLSYKNFLYLLFFLLAIHLFFMGFDGWINPSKWHGGLPPISLVAFIFLLLAYIVNLSFKE